jgi:mRNA interferase RelE/StbE
LNVLFAKPSRKFLARCGKKTGAAIIGAIEGLPDNGDIKKLKGQLVKNTYRLRVGRYRVIYVREDDQVRILDIDARGDIYK